MDERVRRFMEHYAEMPWQVVPPCVNNSFPQLNGTDLAQLEASLGWAFADGDASVSVGGALYATRVWNSMLVTATGRPARTTCD